MKAGMYALLVILLTSTALLIDCGAKRYTMKSSEEIFGTWVSDKSNPQKLTMHPDATWEEYIYQTDPTPSYKGVYEVVEKWKDVEGNTWYKEIVTDTFGLGKSGKSQELDRIDKSGRVWELVYNEMGQYDPDNFPKKIDPKHPNYRIYERAK